MTPYLLDRSTPNASRHQRKPAAPRGLGDGSWGNSEVDPSKPFDVEDWPSRSSSSRRQSVVLKSAGQSTPIGLDNGVNIYGTEGGASLFPGETHRVRGQNMETIIPHFAELPLPDDRVVHFADCLVE
jgi:hypothetical protein